MRGGNSSPVRPSLSDWTSCQRGWTLPPRRKDHCHLCNQARGPSSSSKCLWKYWAPLTLDQMFVRRWHNHQYFPWFFAITFAAILRRTIFQARTFTEYWFGTTLLHISVHMLITRWRAVPAWAIFPSSRGHYTIQNMAPSNTKFVR